jgi:hypothetical protein
MEVEVQVEDVHPPLEEKTAFIYLLNKCTMLFIHLDKGTKKDVLSSIRDFIHQLQSSFQEQEHLRTLSIDGKKEKILQVLIPYLHRLTTNFMIEHIQVDDTKKQYLVREIDSSSLQYARKMVGTGTGTGTGSRPIEETSDLVVIEKVSSTSSPSPAIDSSDGGNGNMVKSLITENMTKMTKVLSENVQEKMSHMEVEIRRYFESQFSRILDSNQEELQGKKEHIQSMIAEIHGQLQTHLEKKMSEEIDQNYEAYLMTNYEKMRDEIRDNMEYKFRMHLQEEMNQKVERLTHILNKNLESSLRENTDLLREDIHAFVSQKIREYDCKVASTEEKIVYDKAEKVLRLIKDGREISSTKIDLPAQVILQTPASAPARALPPVISQLDVTPDGFLTMFVEDENGKYPLRSLHRIPAPAPAPAPAPTHQAQPQRNTSSTTVITKNVHDLLFQKEYVMRLDEENDKTLVVLKSLSVGEKSHCMKPNAIAIGGATCFQENSFALGPQSQTLAKNSVALFGSTAGQNAFAFGAENVTQNVFQVGSKEEYTMDKIILSAREIEFKSEDIKIRVYEEKMRVLEEKIAQLERKIR